MGCLDLDELIAAARRVSQTHQLVERQRERIKQLAAGGESTERAESLLETFVGTLALFEEHERTLRMELEKPNSDR